MQFRDAGDDDAYRHHPELMQESKVIEVAVVEFRFVVPFHLNPNSRFEIIDFVGRYFNFLRIDFDADIELMFGPTTSGQITVKPDGYLGTTATPNHNVTLL